MNKDLPIIIAGNTSLDDRGVVKFINDFKFDNIKRFYIVKNHQQNFIRAWHGHKNESKYILCIKGSAFISTVKIDNFDKPSKKLKYEKWYISENKSELLYIPKGYANGFLSLTADMTLMIFSTSSLNDSLNDDYRYAFDYWNPWELKQR